MEESEESDYRDPNFAGEPVKVVSLVCECRFDPVSDRGCDGFFAGGELAHISKIRPHPTTCLGDISNFFVGKRSL